MVAGRAISLRSCQRSRAGRWDLGKTPALLVFRGARSVFIHAYLSMDISPCIFIPIFIHGLSIYVYPYTFIHMFIHVFTHVFIPIFTHVFYEHSGTISMYFILQLPGLVTPPLPWAAVPVLDNPSHAGPGDGFWKPRLRGAGD